MCVCVCVCVQAIAKNIYNNINATISWMKIYGYNRPGASKISLVRPKYCEMIIIICEQVDLCSPIK